MGFTIYLLDAAHHRALDIGKAYREAAWEEAIEYVEGGRPAAEVLASFASKWVTDGSPWDKETADLKDHRHRDYQNQVLGRAQAWFAEAGTITVTNDLGDRLPWDPSDDPNEVVEEWVVLDLYDGLVAIGDARRAGVRRLDRGTATFSDALVALKAGRKVTRWPDEGWFVLRTGTLVWVRANHHAPPGARREHAAPEFTGALGQVHILAEDWRVVP